MVYISRQIMFVNDGLAFLKTFSTRKIHVWVHGNVWLAARLVKCLRCITYSHGLKWACKKTGNF